MKFGILSVALRRAPGRTPLRCSAVRATAAVVLAAMALVPAAPVRAQDSGLVVTTPYPSIAVQPGARVEFELDVAAPAPQPVALAVADVPAGWSTTLRGGGFVVGAVTAGALDEPAQATLEVRVAPDAPVGTHPIVVRGSGPSGTVDLRLELIVQREVDTGIGVSADFPSLRGDPGSTFTYTLTITNNTPSEQTFTFAPRGPEGWEVTASPTAQDQANTVTIDAGGDAQVRVEATPPAAAPQQAYPIVVDVTSAAGPTGRIELTAEVTGTPMLEVATADQRLSVSGEANADKRVTLIVANTGTAPLSDVKFAATAPRDWEVTFEPAEIGPVEPNETVQVAAVVRPPGGAVAGDYVITIRASAGSESTNLELRYTVKGSRWLGVAGIGVIVVAVAVLAGVFVRFGRR